MRSFRRPALPSARACTWAAIFAASLAGAPGRAAEIVCSAPDARGAQACRAALAEPLVRTMGRVQERSNWCWAAAMEMVLARYGVALPQRTIVASHFGTPVNLRLRTADLAGVLAREWPAPSGERISVRAVRQAEAGAGPLPLSAHLALAALQADHPLLLAAQGHVVVLVELRFTRLRDARFLRVTGGTVIDPRASAGLRPLAPAEMEPDYLGWFDVRWTPAPAAATVALRQP